MTEAPEWLIEINRLRSEAGWPSSRKIAAAIGGISHTYVNDILRGARTVKTKNTLRLIVNALTDDQAAWHVVENLFELDLAKRLQLRGPRTGRPTEVPEPEPMIVLAQAVVHLANAINRLAATAENPDR